MPEEHANTLGDPTARSFFSNATGNGANTEKKPTQESNRRAGDSGLGSPNPTPQPENIRTLSAAEQEYITQGYDAELAERFQRKFSEFSRTGLKIPPAVYRGARLILLLGSGVLGLFILAEGSALYRDIYTLPPWGQYLALGAGGIFIFLIIAVVIRLFLLLFGLKRSPRINLKALSIIEERIELRSLAATQSERARSELKEYLNTYPFTNYSELYSAGLTESTLRELKKARTDLLNSSRPVSAPEWLQSFAVRFQQPLETAAKARIKRFAGKVALGTAASPIGVIDQIIVLYGSLAMIRDILTLYNLRPAFGQSAVMLSRAIMQAYLSGMLGEAAENGAEALSESYEEWSGELLAGSLTGSFKAIFSRSAEAGLNGFLLWRLGKATIAHVQMISNTPTH